MTKFSINSETLELREDINGLSPDEMMTWIISNIRQIVTNAKDYDLVRNNYLKAMEILILRNK